MPVAVVALTLAGYAAPRPVLYPNAHLEAVGPEAAERDLAECRKMAEAAGATAGPEGGARAVEGTVVGAGVGAAGGAIRGAIAGAAGSASRREEGRTLPPRPPHPSEPIGGEPRIGLQCPGVGETLPEPAEESAPLLTVDRVGPQEGD